MVGRRQQQSNSRFWSLIMALNPYVQTTRAANQSSLMKPLVQPTQNLGLSGGQVQWGTSYNPPQPASGAPGMSNPYLGAQADAITQQATQNLQYNVLPTVNSGAVAAGGYGGSRQGIAQGLAMGQTQQGITNSLANLYGNAYESDMNRQNQWGIANLNNSTALQQAQI